MADDRQECLKGSKEAAAAAIAACTRAIQSGNYNGQDLYSLYNQRGYSWSWTSFADRIDRAFQDYTKAIDIDPKAVDALLNRSNIYNKRHDYDRAIADANQAFEGGLSDYGKRVGYGERGYAYQAKGDSDRAIADYTESIRLDANNERAFAARGYAYQIKGDFDRAIADYDQAIALDPEYALAYYNRALVYKAKGDLDRAIADCSQAIALYPKYRDAYFNRADAYRTKGDLDRAIADYDQTIALDPNDRDTYGYRALAHLSKGDFGRSIADFYQAGAIAWLATAAFLTIGLGWLGGRIGAFVGGRSRRRMVELCKQQSAEMQRRNVALERIAAALEGYSGV